MGCHGLPVLAALLLFATEHEVSAQYASVVECLPATTASIARPIVQTGGQYILPAIIQPIVSSYDCCAPDPPFPNYGNFPAPIPGFPPIIVEDDSDIWHHLLYFLIFAMQNKKMNNIINSQNNCGCNSCHCGCNNNNQINTSNDNGISMPTYIPIPIAIPVYTGSDGCSCIDALPGFANDIVIQGGTVQACNGNRNEPNEINLIIRTDC